MLSERLLLARLLQRQRLLVLLVQRGRAVEPGKVGEQRAPRLHHLARAAHRGRRGQSAVGARPVRVRQRRPVGVGNDGVGEVERVEVKRHGGALDGDAVEVAAARADVRVQKHDEVARHENVHSILLRRALEASRQVHVRTQITGIDLVARTNCALNGPADVQPEAHLEAPVRVAGPQAAVRAPALQPWRGVQLDLGVDERGQGLVRGRHELLARVLGEAR